jgi:glycosyltransferase involved in cell wall biosynthesis
MRTTPEKAGAALVQVVGPTDGWVLERLARRLVAKLPYAEFVPGAPRPAAGARLAYYVNYALYERPSGLIDVGFFTHLDETQNFLGRARRVDFCVCMSRLYTDWLAERGVSSVAHIPMGFDAYRYRPRLVLGVVGRLEHPRKGRRLVERLRALPFVDVALTEGRIAEGDLYAFYERLDYVLVPATVEGGPMSLLEGLAMGKPVIAPEGVGMVPEFGAAEEILRYPAGDGDALVRLVTDCYEQKLRRRRLVGDRTWDHWAEAHHRLFARLLEARGAALPQPAAGFRFGMLAELDVLFGADVGELEEAVDRAAAHLYFGDYGRACSALEVALPRHPCVRKLLDTIPSGAPGRPSQEPAHVKALR